VIGTAAMVPASLARPEHGPGRLLVGAPNIHVIAVHRDLSRHSDSNCVGSKIITLQREAERRAA